jgi:hypothetical protein
VEISRHNGTVPCSFPVIFVNPNPNQSKRFVDRGLEKKSTEFPINSLALNEIWVFWAEFEDLEIEFKESPVIFAVFRRIFPADS